MGQRREGVSLKARGKKPLTSLHRLITEQVISASKEYLIRRLKEVIKNRVTNAPPDLIDALSQHLASTPSEPFCWAAPDDHELEIDVSLTADDLIPVYEEGLRFSQEDLPKILPEAMKSAAKVILKSLKTDWPAQHAYDQARMTNLKTGETLGEDEIGEAAISIGPRKRRANVHGREAKAA